MEFDTVELDATTNKEHLIHYWHERAECLEKLVCELLIKNQALRMNLEKEKAIHDTMESCELFGRIYVPSSAAR